MNQLEQTGEKVNAESAVEKSRRERQTLEQKRAALAAKLAAVDEKLKSENRKADARRKILLGAYLLNSGVDLKTLKIGSKSLLEYIGERDRHLFTGE